MSQTRRLAAILAADVAGYSRLMEADEAGTARASDRRRPARRRAWRADRPQPVAWVPLMLREATFEKYSKEFKS
jgi:hypothetical protein